MAETPNSGGPYANSKAVMKLQIGEDGGPIRRIGVSRLLSPEDPTTLSYDALVDLAIQYSFPSRPANRPAFRKNINVSTTYVDEDGDIITISSDEELCEAIDQFLDKKPPVLRVKALAKKKDAFPSPLPSGPGALATGVAGGVVDADNAKKDKKKTAEERREERRRKRAEARLLARTPATSSTTPASVAPPTPSRSSSTASASSQGSAASTSSSPRRRASQQGSPPRQLQTFLETFVSLLSAAVVALQTHLASNGAAPDVVSAFDNIGGRSNEVNNSRTAAKDESTADAAGASSDPSKEKVEEKDEKEEAKQVAERLMREVVNNISLQQASASAPAATKPEEDNTEAAAEAKGSEQTAEKPAAKEEPSATWPENAKVPDGRDPNFIHGRHTCDGCLVTPIVGLRFHATNLPDYDLCQGCVGNYKGKEIKFEAEELARDRPYQHRWARRQAARTSRGGAGCRRGFGGPGGRYPGACRGGPGARRHHGHPQPQDMDMALKEAIRRSLLDANCGAAKEELKKEEDVAVPKKEAEEKPEVVEKRDEEKQEDKQAEEKQKDAEKEIEEVKAEEQTLPASAPVIEETPKTEQPKEESKPPAAPAPTPKMPPSPAASASSRASSGTHESFASAADGNGDIAKAIGVTLDHCAEAIDAVLSEFEKGAAKPANDDDMSDTESKASKASRKSARSQKIGAAVASAVSSAVETAGIAAGVANEIAAAFDKQQQQQKGAAVDVEEVSAMTSSVESAPAVAEPGVPVIAATAPVAPVDYEEFLPPQDRPIPQYDDDDDDEKEEEHEMLSEEPLAADGATILESLASPTSATMDAEAKNDNHDETSKGESEEGWSVVDENEQIEADELLARAAQLVGSAIFQSDMSKSAEVKPAESDASSASSSQTSRSVTRSTSNASTASSASLVSSASSVTSVPSTVPSLMTTEPISAPVLARWAPQLEQLRELGFEDERKSVDVLERLHAANIGVGETDEVTVTDVVNFLLNNAE